MLPPASYLALLGVIATLGAVTWGLQGGFRAEVLDCDETFNYLEALHYFLHGSGMQTWEYAPQYGLRSWFFVAVHAAPIKLVELVVPLTKLQELFVLRLAIFATSCAAEALLCKALAKRYNANVAFMAAGLLGLSTGMGHARRAMLPSTVCMICFALAQALWLMDWFAASLLVGSFSVLVSWPFSALGFIPIGFHALYKRGFVFVVGVAIVALIFFGLIPAAVDSYFYNKPASPTLEMILYNALGRSGGGAHLYGVEPWTFYFKNLFLNFNVVAPVALLALIFGDERTRFYHGLPVMFTFLVFQFMAHKEERFLFTIYPTLCWSAAAMVAPNEKSRPLWSSIRVRLLLVPFVALSISRSLALGRFESTAATFEGLQTASSGKEVLCLGREWHKFPSSFYLPIGTELAWTPSNFKGILPKSFAPKPEGYSMVVSEMNDMNREEPSRYAQPSKCTLVVDSSTPYDEGDALRPFLDTDTWELAQSCATSIDVYATKQPFRSFAAPWDPWWNVAKGEYCLFKRKGISKKQ